MKQITSARVSRCAWHSWKNYRPGIPRVSPALFRQHCPLDTWLAGTRVYWSWLARTFPDENSRVFKMGRGGSPLRRAPLRLRCHVLLCIPARALVAAHLHGTHLLG